MKFLDPIANVYFSTIPWYSLLMWILELENPLDDIYGNDKTYEFLNIDKDVNTSTYIIYNLWINYQNKPHELEYIPPYEFANNYFNVNNTQYYRFLENHPQKHMHTLHKYNMPHISII